MRKLSPNPPAVLRHSGWLRGLDTLVDRVLRLYETDLKHAPKSIRKPLAKTA